MTEQDFKKKAEEVREAWADACERAGANPFSPFGLKKLDELVSHVIRETRAEGEQRGLERAAQCARYKRKAIEAIEHVPNDVKAKASKAMCDEIEVSILALQTQRGNRNG